MQKAIIAGAIAIAVATTAYLPLEELR